jgi:hypothetical protein
MDWDNEDPTDPNCAMGTHSRNVRDFMLGPASAGNIIGGTSIICACPALDDTCPHATEGGHNYYIDDPLGTPTLVEKASFTVLLDGVPQSNINPSPVDKPPGSWVNLKLEGPVEDGYQITLALTEVSLAASDIVLTFDNGSTNSVLLRVPPQGLVGRAHGISLHVRPVVIAIRGWA